MDFISSVFLFQLASATEDAIAGKKEKGLHPRDIDAFWLQRNLRKYFDDPVVAQSKAGEVLGILKVRNNEMQQEVSFFLK